jgi:ribosomal protein L7Ae-like RNA K-turn-binding protein
VVRFGKEQRKAIPWMLHASMAAVCIYRTLKLTRIPILILQAVLVAADCNPKMLTKHIPTLASTRQVPVLHVKDNKGGSMRLGQVVNVRTALAVGVKVSFVYSLCLILIYAILSAIRDSCKLCNNTYQARDSVVNKTIDDFLNRGSSTLAGNEPCN